MPQVQNPPLRALVRAVLAATLFVSTAHATDYVWTGSVDPGNGTREWAEPGNWSPSGVPGAGDTASVTASTSYEIVHLAGTLDALQFGGGHLSSGSLELLNGASTWSDGQLSAAITVDANASLELTGAGSKVLAGGVLQNAGTLLWTGGPIAGSDFAAIHNTGTFEIHVDQDLVFNSATGSAQGCALTNAGTLHKSGTTGQTRLLDGWELDNSGALAIDSGVLSLQSLANHWLMDGTSVSGTVSVGVPGTDFSVPSVQVRASGALHLAVGARLQIEQASPLRVEAVTVSGGGTLASIGGMIAALNRPTQDTLTIAPGSTLEVSGVAFFLSDLDLVNQGTVVWSGDGQFGLVASSIHNAGLFRDEATVALGLASGTGSLVNSGSFVVEQAVPTGQIFQIPFVNTGSVTLKTGELHIPGDGSGGFTQTGGSLQLMGGNLYAGSGSAGPSLQITGGAIEGTGTIGADLDLHARLSPRGLSGEPGLIQVTGNLVLHSDCTLDVTVQSTGADELKSDTGLALDGSLQVAPVSGFTLAPGHAYRIASGPYTGAFASVVTGIPDLSVVPGTQVVSVSVPASSGGGTDGGTGGTEPAPKKGCTEVPELGSLVTLGIAVQALRRRRR